jgi:hypothetical protein
MGIQADVSRDGATTLEALYGFGTQSRRNWPDDMCTKQDLTQGDSAEQGKQARKKQVWAGKVSQGSGYEVEMKSKFGLSGVAPPAERCGWLLAVSRCLVGKTMYCDTIDQY